MDDDDDTNQMVARARVCTKDEGIISSRPWTVTIFDVFIRPAAAYTAAVRTRMWWKDCSIPRFIYHSIYTYNTYVIRGVRLSRFWESVHNIIHAFEEKIDGVLPCWAGSLVEPCYAAGNPVDLFQTCPYVYIIYTVLWYLCVVVIIIITYNDYFFFLIIQVIVLINIHGHYIFHRASDIRALLSVCRSCFDNGFNLNNCKYFVHFVLSRTRFTFYLEYIIYILLCCSRKTRRKAFSSQGRGRLLLFVGFFFHFILICKTPRCQSINVQCRRMYTPTTQLQYHRVRNPRTLIEKMITQHIISTNTIWLVKKRKKPFYGVKNKNVKKKITNKKKYRFLFFVRTVFYRNNITADNRRLN